MPDRKIQFAKKTKTREVKGQTDFFLTENAAFLRKANPSVQEVRDQVRLLTAQVAAILERLREVG